MKLEIYTLSELEQHVIECAIEDYFQSSNGRYSDAALTRAHLYKAVEKLLFESDGRWEPKQLGKGLNAYRTKDTCGECGAGPGEECRDK